ncbi:Protein unc-45 A [Gaertneriomyces sp. JEL0708]|nr:Protein unc-45 A [Gaertneriomyces sp. JEL0708]
MSIATDPLGHLNFELEDFEQFVDEYTSKLNDILAGKDVELPCDANDSVRSERQPKDRVSLDYAKWDKIAEECDAAPAAETTKGRRSTGTTEWKQQKADKLRKLAEPDRLRGNNLFKARNYADAIKAYTAAIEKYLRMVEEADELNSTLERLFPTKVDVDPLLYTNRALCYLKLQDYARAEDDCTAALNIDNACIKAYWRRAEAYRGKQEFEKALDDLHVVRKRASETQKLPSSTRVDPGVSLSDITKLREAIEREWQDKQRDDQLRRELKSDGSAIVVERLIEEVMTAIQDSIKGKTKAPAVGQVRLLTTLIRDKPEIADAVRLVGGFEHLVDPQIFTTGTLDCVLPILSACMSSTANRRHIAPYLGRVLQTILAAQRPTPDVIEAATNILGRGSTAPEFVEALLGVPVEDKKIGCFILAFLGATSQPEVKTGPTVQSHLLEMLWHVMRHSKTGATITSRKWGIEENELLALMPSFISATDEDLIHQSCNYIDTVVAVSRASAQGLHEVLIQAIWKRMPSLPKSSQLLTPLLTTFHNLLTVNTISSHLLRSHDIPHHLVKFLSSSTNVGTHLPSILSVSKLSKQHPEMMKALDGWWDTIPMKSLLEDKCETGTRCGAVIVLAWWLETGNAKVEEWRREGGFALLVSMALHYATVLEKNGFQSDAINDGDWKTVGNLALCISACAQKADHARQLHDHGLTSGLVQLLRRAPTALVQKNLAIACARLCQCADALVTVRELKGIELMYSLGGKILAANQ